MALSFLRLPGPLLPPSSKPPSLSVKPIMLRFPPSRSARRRLALLLTAVAYPRQASPSLFRSPALSERFPLEARFPDIQEVPVLLCKTMVETLWRLRRMERSHSRYWSLSTEPTTLRFLRNLLVRTKTVPRVWAPG